jgi:hypothetical protein
MKRYNCLFTVGLLLAPVANAQPDNVILVTFDGMRWQEVFQGVDVRLAGNPDYTVQASVIRDRFSAATPVESAARLLPFIHGVMEQEGTLIGNRSQGSCAHVTNPWYFSYPGYNEILTGRADPAIDSNDPVPNANVTVLEWLNDAKPGFSGKVAAFGSWNVFPAIINTARSGIPVNVGKPENPQSDQARELALLHDQVPQLWETVRLDVLTHHSAMHYLDRQRPRFTYIAYGETDDFAHDGHYDQYLFAAHRTDAFLNDIWNWVQSTEGYRDNTILVVTTDHGRGSEPVETWQHHASKAAMAGYMESLATYENGIVGSDAVWIAAMGPGIAHGASLPAGECAGSNQITATILELLGIDYRDFSADIGSPLDFLIIDHE